MKFLIHGDHQTQSRQHLNHQVKLLKQNYVEIIRLDGKSINLTDIIQATESQSLFQKEKLVIIERLSANPSKKTQKDISKHLNSTDTDKLTIIIWEPKKLTVTQTKKFNKYKVEEYKTPAIIFKLLDSIRPNQPKVSLNLLKQSLVQESPEFIFYMLTQRIRQLITLKNNKRLAPWQKQRLVRQKKLFKPSELTSIHYSLHSIDKSIKTGTTPLTIKCHLELLLSSI